MNLVGMAFSSMPTSHLPSELEISLSIFSLGYSLLTSAFVMSSLKTVLHLQPGWTGHTLGLRRRPDKCFWIYCSLAHFSLLEVHRDPRTTAKHCVWPGTDFAFRYMDFHQDMSGIELGSLHPPNSVVGVGTQRGHHFKIFGGGQK